MSRVWVTCEASQFRAHLYRTILKRDPESEVPASFFKDADPWDRVVYFMEVLGSNESLDTVNRSDDDVLRAFFSGLGYVGSVPALVELMKDISPTRDSLFEQAEAIQQIIVSNTERVFFATVPAQAFAELDGAASLASAEQRLHSIEQSISSLREEVGHCSWHVSDLKGKISKGHDIPPNEYINGLLHAIMARLEMQDSK